MVPEGIPVAAEMPSQNAENVSAAATFWAQTFRNPFIVLRIHFSSITSKDILFSPGLKHLIQ